MWVTKVALVAVLLVALNVQSTPIENTEDGNIAASSSSRLFHRHKHVEPSTPRRIPLTIPKLSKQEKWRLIRESGQDPESRRRGMKRRTGKMRRDLRDKPWKREQPKVHAVSAKAEIEKPDGPAMALPVGDCPFRFDAIIKAPNGRTYVFSRDRVYQIWRNDNLHQRASFLITDMFPEGPRIVTAALTNARRGVIVLVSFDQVYRYRWSKKKERFHLARNSPQPLSDKITIQPRIGFQWTDGNMIFMENDKFFTYDAYWNIPTFNGTASDYFPNFPRDMVGIVHNGGNSLLLFTTGSNLMVYDTKKYSVVQEYPLKTHEYIGCLYRKA